MKKRTILVSSIAAGILAAAALLGVILPTVSKTGDAPESESALEESMMPRDSAVVVEFSEQAEEQEHAETYDRLRELEKELKEIREELENVRMNKENAAGSGKQKEDGFLQEEDSDPYYIDIPDSRKAEFSLAENDQNDNDIPDKWENVFMISPDFTAADSDQDEDGFTLLQEYNAKTDPTDPKSHPKYITQIFVDAIARQKFNDLQLISVDRPKKDKADWEATFTVIRNQKKRKEFVRIGGRFHHQVRNRENISFELIDIVMDEATQQPMVYIQRYGKPGERIPCNIQQDVFDPKPRIRFLNSLANTTFVVSVGDQFKLGTPRTGEEKYTVASANPDMKKVVVEAVGNSSASFFVPPRQKDTVPDIGTDLESNSDYDFDGFNLEQEYEAGTDPSNPLSHPKYITGISVLTVNRPRFTGLELASVDRTNKYKGEWKAQFNVIRNQRRRSEFVRIGVDTFSNNDVNFRLVDILEDEKTHEPVAYIQRVGWPEERIPCHIRQPVYDSFEVKFFNSLNEKSFRLFLGSSFKLGTAETGEEQYKVVSVDPATKEVVVEALGEREPHEMITLSRKQPNPNPAFDEDVDGFNLEQENLAGTDPLDPFSHPKYISGISVQSVFRQPFSGLELVSIDVARPNKKDWTAEFNVVQNNKTRQAFVQIYNAGGSLGTSFKSNNVDFRVVDIEMDGMMQEPVVYIQRADKQEYIPCFVNQPVYYPELRVRFLDTLRNATFIVPVGSEFKLGTTGTGEERYKVVSANSNSRKVVVEAVGGTTGTFTVKLAPSEEN